MVGLNNINKDTSEIIFKSAEELPEEYKDIPVNIDESKGMHPRLESKTHRESKKNFKYAASIRRDYKKHKKFRDYY